MGLQRLGVSNPSANTDTLIYTASGPFLASIIATNKHASTTDLISIYIVPSGQDTNNATWAYLAVDQDMVPQNTLETHRFALNQNDKVYVKSFSGVTSFMINGLKQVDIALAAGVTSYSNTPPTDTMDGMIWVDKDGNGTALNTLAGQVIQANSTTQVPLTLQGISSQSANLFEIKDSSGNILDSYNSSGFLSIGKSTASKPLEIYSATNPAIRIQNSLTGTTATDGLLIEQNGVNSLFVNYESGSMSFNTNNTNRITIDSGGQVNFNNNIPIYHSIWRSSLDRSWDNYPSITTYNDTSAGPISEFRFHGYPGISGGDYSIVVRSDGGYVTGSDERRKTNIQSISNALDIIKSITGKSFNVINSSGHIQQDLSTEDTGKKFGFIAQEVIDIIPEIVKYYPEADTPNEIGYASAYSVDYASLVPVLVEAIKELSGKIEFLEGNL